MSRVCATLTAQHEAARMSLLRAVRAGLFREAAGESGLRTRPLEKGMASIGGIRYSPSPSDHHPATLSSGFSLWNKAAHLTVYKLLQQTISPTCAGATTDRLRSIILKSIWARSMARIHLSK